MAKTLLIMRHAKSSWAERNSTDFQRPLNQRGLADAPRMAELLVAKQLVPQALFHSSAKRTTMTANILKKSFDTHNSSTGVRLMAREELYLARWHTYVELLAQQASGKFDVVMLLGHNPGVEDLIETLTGNDVTMPTAAIAHLSFDVGDWNEVAASPSRSASLLDRWVPKEI